MKAHVRSIPAFSGRWQVGLVDLMVGVLASCVSLRWAMEAKDVWTSDEDWGGEPIVGYRPLAVATTVLALWLAAALALQVLRLRRSRAGGAARPIGWPIAWRMAGAAALVAVASEQRRWFRMDRETYRRACRWYSEEHGIWLWARERVLPIATVLLMAGLIAAMRRGVGRARSSRFEAMARLAMVPLAAILGLLALAAPALIAYEGLCTLEVVRNYLHRPPTPGAGLWGRIARAGWDVAAAGVACLVMASLVVHDMRRGGDGAGVSRRGKLLRLIALLVTTAAGVYLLLVTLPAIHPNLADGVGLVIGPMEIALIVPGFAVLAAGMASRAVAPPWDGPASSLSSLWGRVAEPVAWGVFLGAAILLLNGYAASLPGGGVEETGFVNRLVDEARALDGRIFGGRRPDPTVRLRFWLDVLVWVACLLSLSVPIIFALFAQPEVRPAPLDAIASSPGRLAWFLWLWIALTITCLAALPAFALGAIVIDHIRVNGGDLLRWP